MQQPSIVTSKGKYGARPQATLLNLIHKQVVIATPKLRKMRIRSPSARTHCIDVQTNPRGSEKVFKHDSALKASSLRFCFESGEMG